MAIRAPDGANNDNDIDGTDNDFDNDNENCLAQNQLKGGNAGERCGGFDNDIGYDNDYFN